MNRDSGRLNRSTGPDSGPALTPTWPDKAGRFDVQRAGKAGEKLRISLESTPKSDNMDGKMRLQLNFAPQTKI